jgi:hypothetical protein
LYPDLFDCLILQESTHCSTQTKSMGSIPFEVLDGGNEHMEDIEDKDSSHELITTNPYQPLSWDEVDVLVDVYQTMSSSSSYSFMINNEASCSSIPIVNIDDACGFHHCIEDLDYTMVGTSPCI